MAKIKGATPWRKLKRAGFSAVKIATTQDVLQLNKTAISPYQLAMLVEALIAKQTNLACNSDLQAAINQKITIDANGDVDVCLP